MSDLINRQYALDMDNLYTDEDLDWEQRQWNLEAEELNGCDEDGDFHPDTCGYSSYAESEN